MQLRLAYSEKSLALTKPSPLKCKLSTRSSAGSSPEYKATHLASKIASLAKHQPIAAAVVTRLVDLMCESNDEDVPLLR